MSNYKYLILGAGRQGTAAAYDLIRFGEPEKIILADDNQNVVNKAVERLKALTKFSNISAVQLDVRDKPKLVSLMSDIDVTLSAVPYYYNLDISKAAIEAKSNLCDMGGHTGIVRQQLALDDEARGAGVSIVPDCGMGPGLIVTLAAYVMELFDIPEEIYIYDGGLPQNPIPPWNYQSTFHINGLTNEMDGEAYFIRKGKVTPVPTLTELEVVDFPPLGKLEADITSGGLSTSPWTFEGKLKVYQNKTLRYPGHFEWWRAYKALGLFSEEPIQVGEQKIVPRDVFHTLLAPHISAAQIRDVCVIRIKGIGKKNKQKTTITLDLIDYYDEKTGFTAMERLTGWHCSIMMIFQAQGVVPPGGIPMEIAVDPELFIQELQKRGIDFTLTYS